MTRSRETRANASAVRTARRAMERKPAVPDGRETWTPRRAARDWTRENALEVIERSRERAEEGKEERDERRERRDKMRKKIRGRRDKEER